MKRSTIVEVVLSLVETVENCNAREMINTVGAVMYDGWTNSSTEYADFYALTCTTHDLRQNSEKQNH